jgi:hypothetical protein
LETEPVDAEAYGIYASDADPRALGTLTAVLATGDELPIEHDNVGVAWTERSSLRLENDGGVWVGTASNQMLGVGDAVGWATWELEGERATRA